MKNRRIFLEILRIISCFLVIARHTNSFVLHSVPTSSITWIITVLYHILSMICVPVFFMISGALFLNKESSHKDMLKKCFFRLFIPLVFFSAIVYFKRYPIFTITNVFEFISQLLNNKILTTYWFIYVLMGLYIATPFLQKMCKNIKEKDYIMLILYSLILLTIIPIFKRYNIFSITNEFSIPLVSIYVVYYIIGNYIFNYDIKLSKTKEYILIFSTILIIIFGVTITYYDHSVLNFSDYYYGGISRVTVFLPSILISYLVRKKMESFNFSDRAKNIILYFSSATFGIYMLHALFIDNLKFIYNFINSILINPFLSVVIYQFILFLILTVIIKIMKKIPILKKII